MKKIICFVFLLTFLINGQAQKTTGCGFIIPPRMTLKTNFKSVYEASEIVNVMLDSIRWKENFRLREENGIQNAYATIINNARWIIYDNNFLEDVDAYTSTKWASISILAHETGHHYFNHVISRTGSTPPKEIEADAFSGYVMQKLGATLNESVAAISAIATDKASSTHPGRKDRVAAITNGWNQALKEKGTPANPTPTPPTKPTTPSNPTPTPNPNSPSTIPADDPSWINLTIQSNKNETVLLSDDGKNYSPAEIKAGEGFLFRFEIYNYGWLRLKYYNGYRVYKLMHGKDYSILWNRRTNNWSVVEVPN